MSDRTTKQGYETPSASPQGNLQGGEAPEVSGPSGPGTQLGDARPNPNARPAGPAPLAAGAVQKQPAPGAEPEEKEPPVSVPRAIWRGVADTTAPLMRFLDTLGGHLILMGKSLVWLPRRPFRGATYLEAMEYIGFGSLPIVLLVGAFTGMVMSLQSVFAFRQFGLESFAGATTGKAIAIELGPVLTSLMLAGRAGAGIATELGTMRISEQIDALESMAVNPMQYLILPRLIAAMIVTPILTLLFFVVGMGGAWLVAVVGQGVDQGQWVANLRNVVAPIDVVQGLIKGVFFGFLVTLIGCYQGFNASGGGRGVGIGVTRAVVIGSASTLVLDYFLTTILLSVLGSGNG